MGADPARETYCINDAKRAQGNQFTPLCERHPLAMYYAFSARISVVGMDLFRDICILIITGTPAGTKLGILAVQYWRRTSMFPQLAVFSVVYCSCSV